MHELSIAQSIVDTVEAQAIAHNAAHVKSVRLRIGEASGIIIDSLTFCFEMLTNLDSALTGAQLLIDLAPYKARCRYCDQEFPVIDFVPQCPVCKEWSNDIVSGTELQILEMEIV